MTKFEDNADKISNGVKFAVIETGGKQYLVKPKDKIEVEKLELEAGAEVNFDKVLLVAEGNDAKVGKPYVTGAKVAGKVLKQARAKKVIILKYHNKTRYRRKKGHRQMYTQVEILKV